MTIRLLSASALAAAALALQACSGGADDADRAEVSSGTLASLVADADELSIVSETLGDAGLAQVFDGAAAYTLFAPQDAAFKALGEAGEALQTAEQRPAMFCQLRLDPRHRASRKPVILQKRHLGFSDVEPSFAAVAHDVDMRRGVIVRVDHHPQPIDDHDRRHDRAYT